MPTAWKRGLSGRSLLVAEDLFENRHTLYGRELNIFKTTFLRLCLERALRSLERKWMQSGISTSDGRPGVWSPTDVNRTAQSGREPEGATTEK